MSEEVNIFASASKTLSNSIPVVPYLMERLFALPAAFAPDRNDSQSAAVAAVASDAAAVASCQAGQLPAQTGISLACVCVCVCVCV
jgi:hypothetical protein